MYSNLKFEFSVIKLEVILSIYSDLLFLNSPLHKLQLSFNVIFTMVRIKLSMMKCVGNTILLNPYNYRGKEYFSIMSPVVT